MDTLGKVISKLFNFIERLYKALCGISLFLTLLFLFGSWYLIFGGYNSIPMLEYGNENNSYCRLAMVIILGLGGVQIIKAINKSNENEEDR